jgi:hypothetical protein
VNRCRRGRTAQNGADIGHQQHIILAQDFAGHKVLNLPAWEWTIDGNDKGTGTSWREGRRSRQIEGPALLTGMAA